MSLATRCPVCQTVFRVVQDQLKVSEGWVRCGRCAKVFNAFEGLFDLEREFPALRSPTPSQRVLEDLATRNRQPKPATRWEGDSDTKSGVRDASPPSSGRPAAPATVAATTSPHIVAPRALVPPTAAPVQPRPPASPPVPTPSATSLPQAPPAPPRAPIASTARTAHSPGPSDKDEGATIPPTAAPAEAPGTAVSHGGRAAAMVAAKAAAMSPPAAPAMQHAPAKLAVRAEPELAIRDEPAPVPGTGSDIDPAGEEESFQALFRSDGELAQPTAADDVDIMLDGNDVEPASLDPDDAVDSRLLTFVQQADRAERWRRPWVRATLALAALGLSALLAAQLLVVQRDAVVTKWPGSRSLVHLLCAPLDCRIEPLRRIDQLGVDSSGLTRIDDGPVYRLVLVLRNRGDTPLLMPSIDLSLSDAAGVLVARRMLSAADLGTARNTIAAGQEIPLQALLMSADRPLTGYTIEIFYP